MCEARTGWADRLVRWTTTGCVVVLAGIAAVISYKHMFELVQRYGETSWTAALLPVSVDGMIVASSMSLLADSRQGRRSGPLPWTLLVIGSAASLAANVAVAEPSVVGRLIAAWPSCALIGSYELLMRQVRQGSQHRSRVIAYEATYEVPEMQGAADESHTDTPDSPSGADASYEDPTMWGDSPDGSYEVQTPSTADLIRDADQVPAGEGSEGAVRTHPEHGWPVSALQRQAWGWALAHRTPTGDLPSGRVIAEHFGRRERWGRLVKQAGNAGRLDPAPTPWPDQSHQVNSAIPEPVKLLETSGCLRGLW